MVVVLSQEAECYRGNGVVTPTVIESLEEIPVVLLIFKERGGGG